jgi:hypothetical protein
MNRFLAACAATLALGLPSLAEARCYHFDNSPSDVYVCVGRNGSDSQADREAGQKICTEKSGKKCGPVGSHSSSCHSNAGYCYDEKGNASRSLNGY